MAFRCNRRPRSVSEPERRPRRPPRRKFNHTLILRVYYPSGYTDREVQDFIGDWLIEYEDKHERIPSMFEINKKVEKKFISNEKPFEYKNVCSLAIDTYERQAMLWMMGESINESLMYRNPDPHKKINEDCYSDIISDVKCEICQDSASGRKVQLKSCDCIFHEDCIKKSYGYKQTCPICIKSIDDYVDDVYDIEIDPEGIEVIV